MKIFKNTIILFIIVLILAYAGMTIYMALYGQPFVKGLLEKSLKRKVELAQARYLFPFSLKLTAITIPTGDKDQFAFKAKEIVAEVSLESLVQGRLIFDSVAIDRPDIVIETTDGQPVPAGDSASRHGVVIVPAPPEAAGPDAGAGTKAAGQPALNRGISVNTVVIRDGHVQYSYKSTDEQFSFILEEVYLKSEHLTIPLQEERTKFDLSGRLVKKGNPLSGSSVKGFGWVDVVSRGMDAKVEVIESDGSVGLSAQAVSKNNDMRVTGEVKFHNILMGTKSAEPSESSAVNELLSSVLSSSGVEIGAKFSFKTKMDNFRPEKFSFSGNVVTR